jgi:putative peptidoglycan lipid II flippase
MKTMIKRLLSISSTASLNWQIFHASALIAVCTIGVKLVGLVKEQATAAAFGTQTELNIFILACAVPLFLVTVIASSFNAAFVPTYVKVRENKGESAAQELLSQMATFIFLLLGAVAIFSYAASDLYLPFLTANYSQEEAWFADKVLLIIVPGVVASGFSTLWRSVLNSQKRFVFATLATAITPLAIFVAIYFGAQLYGVVSIAWGTTLGMMLQASLMAFLLVKKGISLKFRKLSWNNPDFKLVVGQSFTVIGSSLILSSSIIVDQIMTARLAPTGVAALAYASRLISFPINIATTALGTAVVPYFAAMAARRDYRAMRHTLNRYLVAIFLVMALAILTIMLFSTDIVSLIYQRGSFTTEDTTIVATILICFALQLPFYTGAVLISRMISSLNQNWIMIYGNVISVILNISFNYLFALKLGVAGIALSTSCVYLVSFMFLFFFLKNYLSRQERGMHTL